MTPAPRTPARRSSGQMSPGRPRHSHARTESPAPPSESWQSPPAGSVVSATPTDTLWQSPAVLVGASPRRSPSALADTSTDCEFGACESSEDQTDESGLGQKGAAGILTSQGGMAEACKEGAGTASTDDSRDMGSVAEVDRIGRGDEGELESDETDEDDDSSGLDEESDGGRRYGSGEEGSELDEDEEDEADEDEDLSVVDTEGDLEYDEDETDDEEGLDGDEHGRASLEHQTPGVHQFTRIKRVLAAVVAACIGYAVTGGLLATAEAANLLPPPRPA